MFLGTFDFASAPFDWGNDDRRQRIPLKDYVIYEMPVRAFTAHHSSGLPEGMRGTYLGLAEKVRSIHTRRHTRARMLTYTRKRSQMHTACISMRCIDDAVELGDLKAVCACVYVCVCVCVCVCVTQAEYLADLGVNAVELLPVFEYDELEFRRTPNPR